MKALRFIKTRELIVEEREIPEINPDEVLVKVMACGICGSDVHGYLGLTGRRIPPMTMGHEFSGIITKTGANVNEFNLNDAVIVQPINFCNNCDNCKNGLTNMCTNKKFFGVLTEGGAMAQYIAVPQKLLYRLPKNCSFEVGALAEPYAVAYGSVKKAGDLKGKQVLIIGAGTIGLCILQLVKLQNPAQVIVCDLSTERLKTAKKLGADEAIHSGKENFLEKIKILTNNKMMDLSIEAVGVEATANQSIKCLKAGGTAIWVGMSQKEMTINMQDIVCSARRVIGSFNYTHKEFGEVVKLIGEGGMPSEALISKTVSLQEAAQAFEDLYNCPDQYIKIIIKPNQEEA